MSTHIGIDIGSVHTDVVVHVQSVAGDAGRLTVSRFATATERLPVDLDAAVWRSGADWADVDRVACGTSMAEPTQSLLGAMPSALRQAGVRGPVYFMQPDASLATSPWNDARSGPVAGMLAACVLSRLIGETTVLAVDVGATGVRCALIRDGRMAMAAQAVALEVLAVPTVESLRHHCERSGQNPRACTLLVFGGGGAARAVELAVGLGCARAVVPQNAAAFSAWGLLQAERRIAYSHPRTPGDTTDAVFEQLLERVLREAAAEGIAEGDLRLQRADDQDRYRLTASSAVSTVRLAIRPGAPASVLATTTGGEGGIDADSLPAGTSIAGPAQLHSETRALRLPSQSMLTVDSYGNLVIELAQPERAA